MVQCGADVGCCVVLIQRFAKGMSRRGLLRLPAVFCLHPHRDEASRDPPTRASDLRATGGRPSDFVPDIPKPHCHWWVDLRVDRDVDLKVDGSGDLSPPTRSSPPRPEACRNGWDYARSKSSISASSTPWSSSCDSPETAAPSPAVRVVPLSSTVPRPTCSQA